MKSNLAKLGKGVLALELSKDPFNCVSNEKNLCIVESNERFDLSKTFSDSEEKVVSISETLQLFKVTKFYCWNALMGIHALSFNERKTFVDAIAEIEDDTIIRMGIMPTHLIHEIFISTSDMAKVGCYAGDGNQKVVYEIYYLHPDQREKINQAVFSNANPMTFETAEEFTLSHGYFPQKGIIGGPR